MAYLTLLLRRASLLSPVTPTIVAEPVSGCLAYARSRGSGCVMLVNEYVDYIASRREQAKATSRIESIRYYSQRFAMAVGPSHNDVIASLTHKDYILLTIIAVSEGISLTELAHYTQCARAVIQHNLQVLISKHLIEVHKSPYDVDYYEVLPVVAATLKRYAADDHVWGMNHAPSSKKCE